MMKAGDDAVMPQVLAHYQLVGPLIEAALAKTPIVFANFPDGLTDPPRYHFTTVPLSVDKMLWLVHREYAIEFFTWAPALLNVAALHFGRILLLPALGVDCQQVKLAALAIRALLFDVAKLEAVPLLDGGTGIALWIPFADKPQADTLRPWLHRLCTRAVALHPDLVPTAFNTHKDGRVHLHVESNASGHYSSVPYGLRAPALSVCAPIRWTELASFPSADSFRRDTIAARLDDAGDVFASEVKPTAGQKFASVPTI